MERYPIQALDNMMREDYREAVVKVVLEQHDRVSAGTKRQLRQVLRQNVEINGFRDLFRAPVTRRLQPTLEMFRKSPRVLEAVIVTWVEIHQDLHSRACAFLNQHDIPIEPWPEGSSSSAGFCLPEEAKDLIDEFRSQFPDSVYDDTYLMFGLICIPSGQKEKRLQQGGKSRGLPDDVESSSYLLFDRDSESRGNLELPLDHHSQLRALRRDPSLEPAERKRVEMLLRLHDGKMPVTIAKYLDCSVSQVRQVLKRYKTNGVRAVLDMDRVRILLTPDQYTQLQELHDAPSLEPAERKRVEMLLWSHDGKTPVTIAKHLDCSVSQVRQVLKQYKAEGIRAVLYKRPGRPLTALPTPLRRHGSLLVPIQRMMERVKANQEPVAKFNELLYAGEFLFKITVMALVAAIEDNREDHRYRYEYALVRADSLGYWAGVLNDIFSGPAEHLPAELVEDCKVFTTRVGKDDSWQYKAIEKLHEVLTEVYPGTDQMGRKVTLRAGWFDKFVEVRNATRGHGALESRSCSKVVSAFEKSILLLIDHNPIFQKPWAYLQQRHLSKEYRVVSLGGDTPKLPKKTSQDSMLPSDGVYVWIGRRPRHVPLLYSNPDTTDFFVPNGKFNGKTFEIHSPITNERCKGDANPYLSPPTKLPSSETEGQDALHLVENVFTNLPSMPVNYVERPRLECEAYDLFTNERHPIVTLKGGGGIGKTSLSLAILHKITTSERYDVIVWFSARDIDLKPRGPTKVRPKTRTKKEIAQEYVNLMKEYYWSCNDSEPPDSVMQDHMHRSSENSPKTMFVFDNFETIIDRRELFEWIDTHINSPNKVVITSRFDEFEADKPINVSGMEERESRILIQNTADKIGIPRQNLTNSLVKNIIQKSDGHPYVIKIFLGEVAEKGTLGGPRHVFARREDTLDALFQRTYNDLSSLARYVFLVLSGWGCHVPQLAIEAMLHTRDSPAPEEAIKDLIRMSLIEKTKLDTKTGSEIEMLEIPITATLFGKKKLEVSEHLESIQKDMEFLQNTCPQRLDLYKKYGVKAVFKHIANEINKGSLSLEEIAPTLEFMADSCSDGWLFHADLEKEVGNGLENEAKCIRRFLEEAIQGGEEASKIQVSYRRLASLHRQMGDVRSSISAFLRAAEIDRPELDEVSSMAEYVLEQKEFISDLSSHPMLNKLVNLMKQYTIATLKDLSRLVQLYVHLGHKEKALQLATQNWENDQEDLYFQRLILSLIQ